MSAPRRRSSTTASIRTSWSRRSHLGAATSIPMIWRQGYTMATTIGTYEALRALLEANALGRVGDEELSRAQDDAIRAVIRKQEEIGLPVVTDGEFRRRNFQDSFGASVRGYALPEDVKRSYLERQAEITKEPFRRAEQIFAAPGPAIAHRLPVRERLQLVRNVPLEEYRFAASVATRPVKETLVSVDRIFQRFAHERSKDVYADVDEFVADVVAIERRMIAELVA